MSIIDVTPATTEIATTEEVPLGFDATAYISGSDTVTLPTSLLRDTGSYTTIALGINPTVVGNVITQTVLGSLLTRGHTYELLVSYTAQTGPPPKIMTMRLSIYCPA